MLLTKPTEKANHPSDGTAIVINLFSNMITGYSSEFQTEMSVKMYQASQI